MTHVSSSMKDEPTQRKWKFSKLIQGKFYQQKKPVAVSCVKKTVPLNAVVTGGELRL